MPANVNSLLQKAKSFNAGRSQHQFVCTEDELELAKAYFDGELTAAQVFHAVGGPNKRGCKTKAGVNSWARGCLVYAYRLKWLK